MEPRQPLGPLITPIPPGTRQSKRTLVVLGTTVLLAGVVLIVVQMGGTRPMLSREPRDRPMSDQVMVETHGSVPDDLRLPSSYARQAIPAAPVPALESIPTRQPGALASTANGSPQALTSTPEATPLPSAPPKAPERQPALARPGPPAQTQAPKEPLKRWFSSVTPMQGDVLTPPFPAEQAPGEPQGTGRSTLFPQAVWETPADPTKVLYADQVVHGLLMQSLTSDIPGTVRVKVTEAVQDRFGQGRVLLPIDTTFLGRQEGRTQYGQARIPVTITMAILPNGSAIAWKNGQAGDATGGAGIPAQVNNHYGKVILGAGLSALLTIGVRAPFGSAEHFQPSLPQEFAQETAQSLGQSAQGIVRRELNVSPTLTVQYATPVTLSFAENVSFQTQPTIVHR